MSRGWGTVQRAVMELLEETAAEERPVDRILNTYTIAALVFDVQPDAKGVRLLTDSQLSSVRRALARLRREGLVEGRRGFRDGRQRWGTPAAITAYEARTRGALGALGGAAS